MSSKSKRRRSLADRIPTMRTIRVDHREFADYSAVVTTETCPACKGKSFVPGLHFCHRCKGSGFELIPEFPSTSP